LPVFRCNTAASRRLDPGPTPRRTDARDFHYGLLVALGEGIGFLQQPALDADGNDLRALADHGPAGLVLNSCPLLPLGR